jgi:hypothetical protein
MFQDVEAIRTRKMFASIWFLEKLLFYRQGEFEDLEFLAGKSISRDFLILKKGFVVSWH